MLQSLIKIGIVALGLWCSASVSAGTVTCGSVLNFGGDDPDEIIDPIEREASLGDALLCKTTLGNINSGSQIENMFGGTGWTKDGELTGDGTNDLLTATAIDWDENDVTGAWAIDTSFWNIYSSAVISMHFGNGNGDPDSFAWLITPETLSGTFSYKDMDGKGGGLSNMFLFGSGTPREIPEPQFALLLLMGLVSMFAVRRRI